MAVTNFSPLLGLALPTTGDLSGTWGTTVNDSITGLIDSAVAGTTNVSTDANVTLTTTNGAANQARNMVLLFSGARTAIRTITAPAQSKVYTVINATTGGFAVTLVGAGPTTGLTIPNGASAVVAWNGSDFVEVGAGSIGNLVVNGTLTVTGATTLQSTLAVTGNITNTAGTANGVAYLNGSKVVTSGSALTFNGSNTFTVIPATGTAYNRTESTQYSTWLQTGAGNANVFWEFSAGTPLRWVDTSAGELMRLTSTGLGIGTSSPAYKLDVVAASNSANTIAVRNTDTSTANYATQAYFSIEVAGNHIGGLKSTAKNLGGLSTPALYLTTAGAYPIAFGLNNSATPSMVLDASGNLGLGVTPSAWAGTGVKAFQFQNGSLAASSTFGTMLAWNTIYDGSYKYVSSTTAGMYQFGGAHAWYTAPSGTAGNAITFTQAMTLDASGNLAIGTTTVNSANNDVLTVGKTSNSQDVSLVVRQFGNNTAANIYLVANDNNGAPYNSISSSTHGGTVHWKLGGIGGFTGGLAISTSGSERARIDSSGNLLFAKTTTSVPDVGIIMLTNGRLLVTSLDQDCLVLNRQSTDGVLAEFRHANTTEGDISISGTTVSYNGGHLSRYAQTTTAKDESLLKGTVLSNLDEMNVYTKDGQPVANEQLNKVKVSDVEGDANVAGVFVNWSHDEDHNVDEINMAMTGDMIIRIAQGTTVVRGDLLMSAGDGTAKPQGDDIIRSKTVAKVTSNHITCTYADGSYCVPCVLMAC